MCRIAAFVVLMCAIPVIAIGAESTIQVSCISDDGKLRKAPDDPEGLWTYSYEHLKGKSNTGTLRVGAGMKLAVSDKSVLKGPLAQIDTKHSSTAYWVERVRFWREDGKNLFETFDDQGRLAASTEIIERVVLCRKNTFKGSIADAFQLKVHPGKTVPDSQKR